MKMHKHVTNEGDNGNRSSPSHNHKQETVTVRAVEEGNVCCTKAEEQACQPGRLDGFHVVAHPCYKAVN